MFKFRRRGYTFSLSRELFSSADIDTGSRFLLKIFSDFLDRKILQKEHDGFFAGNKAARQFPFTVLDSGCGTGVLGICAAGALSDPFRQKGNFSPPSGAMLNIRCQDRDELARLFTEYNAGQNSLLNENFSAHTEPLLAGPAGQRWNLILTNIPAKAGLPVLNDFVSRSAGLLKKDGLVFLVAVNTLADFFRSEIAAAGAPLFHEEGGNEHTVFVYGPADKAAGEPCEPVIFDEKFPHSYPFYIRNKNSYQMQDISYRLDTVHGAPDFDSPGGAIQAAAKLAEKINLRSRLEDAKNACNAEPSLLIHDSGQGHFALWLSHYLENTPWRWILSGRNIVALGAARAALVSARNLHEVPHIVPCADIPSEPAQIHTAGKPGGIALFAYFPEKAAGNLWSGSFIKTYSPGSIIIAGLSSTEAERVDRVKPQGFTRLGDIRRQGFRALAYQVR